eukprot:14518-Heterococcus_DN1.PRE.2
MSLLKVKSSPSRASGDMNSVVPAAWLSLVAEASSMARLKSHSLALQALSSSTLVAGQSLCQVAGYASLQRPAQRQLESLPHCAVHAQLHHHHDARRAAAAVAAATAVAVATVAVGVQQRCAVVGDQPLALATAAEGFQHC